MSRQGGGYEDAYDTICDTNRPEPVASALVPSHEYENLLSHFGQSPLAASASQSGGKRHTTINPLYGGSEDTPTHSATVLEKFSGTIADEAYSVDPSCSFKSPTVVLLSLLAVVGLLMACAAVALTLSLWFGMLVPGRACPSTTASSTTCPQIDLEPCYIQVDAQTALLNKTFSELQANLSILQGEVMSPEFDLTSSLNQLEYRVNNVSNTCTESLQTLSSQNVSVAGLDFEAQLLSVGVYNSCVYEYLDECEMPVGVNNCSTNPTDILLFGYFNLDIACHIEVSQIGLTSVFYPISNLRMSNANGTTFTMDASVSDVLESGQVRCDCTVVQITALSDERTTDFTCRLFRARCPTISTLNTTIVTD